MSGIVGSYINHRGSGIVAKLGTDAYQLTSQGAGVKAAIEQTAIAGIADNAVTLAKMAGGTDGNIISYDASGDPVAIATGTDGQVLTSTGAGSPPAFEAAASGSVIGGASASPDGQQAITTETWTKVDLETEWYDSTSEFASSTYTVGTTGKYLLSAQVEENGEVGTCAWSVGIYKNGSIFLRGDQTSDYAVGYTFPIAAIVVPLSANDTLELYVLRNQVGDLNINYYAYSTYLNVLRVL